MFQPAAANPPDTAVDLEDVAFVSWNVHVGNGDVFELINDLRAGRLTGGRPVDHFVLMLQEALRSEGVPPYRPGAAGARRIDTGSSRPVDVVDVSRELGLSLIYVPSMRNGTSPSEAATDRGSAVLSTLPLSDPRAVELPGERQRRVAIVATLALPSPVSVGVVHLDALGASRRLWLLGTPTLREIQVKSIGSLLPGGSLVLGADLNTWHGPAEPAPRYLARIFGEPEPSFSRASGVRKLDYMYFRAPQHARAEYEVVTRDYGSDHRPLLGRITRIPPALSN